MSVEYLSPAEEIRLEQRIVNSRFIATLAPASSTEEARNFIGRIKKEFSKASHNVPAFIIGGGNNLTDYCSDDGEPSGTAGRPVLAVLRGSGLGDVAVVVTRFFGGTLLGKGGLVKAYTSSTQMVVEAVPRARKQKVVIAALVTPYKLFEVIRLLIDIHKGEILEESFAADVRMNLRIAAERYDQFEKGVRERSSGSIHIEIIETSEMLLPV